MEGNGGKIWHLEAIQVENGSLYAYRRKVEESMVMVSMCSAVDDDSSFLLILNGWR